MAEKLRSGLQNRVRRCDSGSGLQNRIYMGKKKKFKKFSRAEIIAEIQKSEPVQSAPQKFESQPKESISANSLGSQSFSTSTPVGAEMQYVSTDLKKIAVVFTIILIILAGIIYIDKTTPILTNFIDVLVKNLNINQ